MRRPLRLIAAASASLALLASPVMARDQWSRGPGHGWDRRDRDNGVDAGDVIAGVAVIGAIAAIAGVFDGDRDDRQPVPVRYPDQPNSDYARNYEGAGSTGMDRAVDMCVGEIASTGAVVGSIDSASRTGAGWFVSGAMDAGAPFTCRIGNDGRIENVEIGDDGGQGAYYGAGYDDAYDNQYDDATYAQARAELDGYSVR